jgi:phosphoribosylformylglycinamidine synthase PurS subunit
MTFHVAVHVLPRRGILDPQGKAVTDALHTLGFPDVAEVHVGRHLLVEVTAADANAARERVTAMCQKLLANPVTEDFQIAGVQSA